MNTDTAAPADDDAFGRLVARAVRELPDAPEALQRAAIDLFPAAGVLSGVKALAQAVVRTLMAPDRYGGQFRLQVLVCDFDGRKVAEAFSHD